MIGCSVANWLIRLDVMSSLVSGLAQQVSLLIEIAPVEVSLKHHQTIAKVRNLSYGEILGNQHNALYEC